MNQDPQNEDVAGVETRLTRWLRGQDGAFFKQTYIKWRLVAMIEAKKS